MAEFMSGDSRTDSATKSAEAYQTAAEIGNQLETTHPIRLGLALNFSVFHYEIMNNPDKACSLARVVSTRCHWWDIGAVASSIRNDGAWRPRDSCASVPPSY